MRVTVAQAATVGAFLMVLVIAVVTTVTVPEYGTDRALAMADNFAVPVAVSVVVMTVTTAWNRGALLKEVARIVVLAMLVNTVITVLQVAGFNLWLVQHWLPGGESAVYLRAETLGRYSGILNQPALAGILYGIALLLSIFLLRYRPLLMPFVLAVLFVGATLAVSKAFFFVSLPVVLVYWLVTARSRGLLSLVTFCVVAVLLWNTRGSIFDGVRNAFPSWSGVDRLESLLVLADLDLRTATGGRFGDNSSLEGGFAAVSERAPILGFGLQGTSSAADSTWLLVFMVSGLLGVVCFAAMLLSLVIGVARRTREYERTERHLYAAVTTVIIVSSAAFPVVVGNRLAVVVWTLLMLMLSARSPTERAKDKALGRICENAPVA
jgi:hypothetical protein